MSAPRVTAKLLKSLGACPKGVADFREVFPRGCAVTVRNVDKAEDACLNMDWLMNLLLTARERQRYCDERQDAWHAWTNVDNTGIWGETVGRIITKYVKVGLANTKRIARLQRLAARVHAREE